ncbi:hypothetical protein [Candidatus Nephthysia bennettiae]|uniref:Uncharacterized protein n=1 Tax=Candidatus Nephthysia bennettiae TaxID=3127016 RepID=A0A934K376_9BACT|nr:hypothetical protein [Candidatus Dormibacteraeota bacterium]
MADEKMTQEPSQEPAKGIFGIPAGPSDPKPTRKPAAAKPPKPEPRTSSKVVCLRQKGSTGEWYATELTRKRAIGGQVFKTQKQAEAFAKEKGWNVVATPEAAAKAIAKSTK